MDNKISESSILLKEMIEKAIEDEKITRDEYDKIIQLIEAGNVSLPLRSTLISGSQSLFGVKTELQFGKTHVTAIFSQQQSETKNITVEGGAQTSRFKLTALDYEQNKHFFFAHSFRELYPKALARSNLRGLSTFTIESVFLHSTILSLRVLLSGFFQASLI